MPSQKYLKINGTLVNYSDADPVEGDFSNTAPAQNKFSLLRHYDDPLPLNGQRVEWFLRDDTKLWGGIISEVDWAGADEGNEYIRVPITAVGYNDRLFHRTTWNRNTFVCAQYRSTTAVVDVSGTDVTWVSGTRFDDNLVGKTVTVDGDTRTVTAVPDPRHLTLNTAITAGSASSTDFQHAVMSGAVIKDLLDTFCEFEGFTYDVGGTTIHDGAVLDDKGLLFDPPVPVQDAINTVLGLNSDYYFSVDENQLCYFGPRTAVAAPVDFTPTSGVQKRGVSIRVTSEDVRNVEISVTSWNAIDPRVYTLPTDGSTQDWFIDGNIASVDRLLLNGVEKRLVDGSGTDTGDLYYWPATNIVWQDPGDPAWQSTDVVEVHYKRIADQLIEYADETARLARVAVEGSGSGRYEQVIDRTALAGKTPALAHATAAVNRLKDDLQQITVKTFETGFKVGQVVTLTIPKLRLDGALMYIEAVRFSDSECKGTIYDFEYELSMVSVSRRLTDDDVLGSLFGGSGNRGQDLGGGGGATAAGTVPVASGPFERTLRANDLAIGTNMFPNVLAFGATVKQASTVRRVTGVLRKTITSDLTVKIYWLTDGSTTRNLLGTFTIPSTQAVKDAKSWVGIALTNTNIPDMAHFQADITASDGSKDKNGVASFTIEWVGRGAGQVGADGWHWQGPWDNGTTYAKDDLVTKNNKVFLSLIDANTGNDPETHTAEWAFLIEGIAGNDGLSILSGSGAPSSGLGIDGDFYIDTTAHTIYGPKTSGSWGSSTSLIGPTGPAAPHGFGTCFYRDGVVLVSGKTLYVRVPFGGTLSAWSIIVDAGTATIKVWKVASGTAIPTSSNSINTSGVSISSGTAVRSTTLTDFTTTTFTDNDLVAVHLEAVSGASMVIFQVEF